MTEKPSSRADRVLNHTPAGTPASISAPHASRLPGGDSAATVYTATRPGYGSGCPGPATASPYTPEAATTASRTANGARRRHTSGSTLSELVPYAVQVAGSSSGARGTTNGSVIASWTSSATPRSDTCGEPDGSSLRTRVLPLDRDRGSTR